MCGSRWNLVPFRPQKGLGSLATLSGKATDQTGLLMLVAKSREVPSGWNGRAWESCTASTILVEAKNDE